jgi:hypothetical protein
MTLVGNEPNRPSSLQGLILLALWDTRYSTREEIIRAVGRLLLVINRSGRADGVRCPPQIWQKVVTCWQCSFSAGKDSGLTLARCL